MLSRSILSAATALLASSALVAAQTHTDCNPTNTTNCPADPAFGMDFNFVFNQTQSTWDTTAGSVQYDRNTGAAFTIAKQGDSPTIRSQFYIFFGRIEVWMKAASGTGVISSLMLLSDDLDEIDWEFMGGNVTHAETNYFGKGAQDFHNAIYYPVNQGVQADYHNYTIVWTKDSLDYHIDGAHVRTLLPKDANNTQYYPQTPMRLSMGIWAGGDPKNAKGTIDWAGGQTDYSKGPYTMYVKSTRVTDYNSGKEYTYGDKTGSWQSIRVVTGNSTAHDTITAAPAPTLADRWNALSPTAKLAIYASAGGLGFAFVAWALFYCIRQRRRGRREAAIAERKAEAERMELEQFKKAGIDPDSFVVENSEYDAKEMSREGLTTKDSYSVPSTPAGGPNDKPNWSSSSLRNVGTGAGAGAAVGTGMRSPVPLLREGAQSPRVASPALDRSPYHDAHSPYDRSLVGANMSRDATRSPMQNQPSPGLSMGGNSTQRYPSSPGNAARSFTAPGAQMRVASPGAGMQRGGYDDLPRRGSPGPMATPPPQRSYTGGSNYGRAPPPRNQYGGGGNQGYWNNNGGGQYM